MIYVAASSGEVRPAVTTDAQKRGTILTTVARVVTGALSDKFAAEGSASVSALISDTAAPVTICAWSITTVYLVSVITPFSLYLRREFDQGIVHHHLVKVRSFVN